MLILVFGSWLYDKKTHKTHSVVALSAPVYTFALILQLFMAWSYEGGVGFDCSVPGSEGKLDKVSYNAFVGWITFVIILILVSLNVGFFIYMNYSRKLKYDDLWQAWKDKDSRRMHYRLVLGFSAGVSLLLTNLMISNFLGRKRYNA
jgi:ABC-type Fe3+ transport system permease subunit